jgi:hypothetical protein
MFYRIEPRSNACVADGVDVNLEASAVECADCLGECFGLPDSHATLVWHIRVRAKEGRSAALNNPIGEELDGAGCYQAVDSSGRYGVSAFDECAPLYSPCVRVGA